MHVQAEAALPNKKDTAFCLNAQIAVEKPLKLERLLLEKERVT
jgi:hypothetical protein